MTAKGILQIIAEKITGKSCKNCLYKDGIKCKSVNREKCVQSIYPIAWENRTRRGTKNEIDTEGK